MGRSRLDQRRHSEKTVLFFFAPADSAVPLLELGVEDAVWKALPADPDAFQYAVAAQLVQHQERVYNPCEEQRHSQRSYSLPPPRREDGETLCMCVCVSPGVLVSLGMMQRTKCG